MTVVSAKMLSEKPRLPSPAGRSAAAAVSISPRPCRKSVSTLVWLIWKASSWSPAYVARTWLVAIGCIRPTRASSARCHISLTGLRIALLILAASSAASKKSRRPNEPPPCMTCTLTLSWGSPTAWAIAAWAAIGVFSPDQTSARSDRTSATAALVSSAELLRKWKVNDASTDWASGVSGTARHRQLGLLQLGLDVPVGQPGDRPVRPLDPHRPDRVDALSERVGPHRHAGVDDRDVVHSAHPRHLRAVEQPLRGAVERGRPADHGRQCVLDPKVGGERLLAGHRVARVEPVLTHADHPERARVLERDLDLAAPLRGGGLGQLAVRRALAAGRLDHPALGDQLGSPGRPA